MNQPVNSEASIQKSRIGRSSLSYKFSACPAAGTAALNLRLYPQNDYPCPSCDRQMRLEQNESGVVVVPWHLPVYSITRALKKPRECILRHPVNPPLSSREVLINWSEAERKAIFRDAKKICKALPKPRGHKSRWFDSENPKPPSISQELWDQILELRDRGLSATKIARQVEGSKSNIQRWLKYVNRGKRQKPCKMKTGRRNKRWVQMKNPKPPSISQKDWDRILELRDRGFSFADIARQTGGNQRLIQKWIRLFEKRDISYAEQEAIVEETEGDW